MSAEIIPFHRSSVVIDCGWIQHVLPSGERGPKLFEVWVDYFDEEGGCAAGVWSGQSYREAREAAAEFDLPIIDNVRGRM